MNIEKTFLELFFSAFGAAFGHARPGVNQTTKLNNRVHF